MDFGKTQPLPEVKAKNTENEKSTGQQGETEQTVKNTVAAAVVGTNPITTKVTGTSRVVHSEQFERFLGNFGKER